MLEPNPTRSQPTDELDTEIKEAQAQLSNLKRQRRLIELQQQVADEQRALEVAWHRLAATTSKDYSPTTCCEGLGLCTIQMACRTDANQGQQGWYYPSSKQYSPCTISAIEIRWSGLSGSTDLYLETELTY